MRRYTQLIDVDDLAANLRRDNWRVVDCRFNLMQPEQGRLDYESAHIPGAVHAHLDRDLAAPIRPETGRHPLPEAAVFDDTLRNWGISNETQVVAYDDATGALAARLWWLLRWRGHTAVAVLDGGFAAWQRAGEPVSAAALAVHRGRFAGRGAVVDTVDSAEILRRLESDDEVLLVDARDADRFAGRKEPIDAVAGHVPGAVNFPFAQNISGNGRWLAADQLRERWEAALAGPVPPEWAVMCGSGVTACSLALSADIAGIPAPRLYTGSWSEWIRDPARPVEP